MQRNCVFKKVDDIHRIPIWAIISFQMEFYILLDFHKNLNKIKNQTCKYKYLITLFACGFCESKVINKSSKNYRMP